jgi:zinc/manganese transport system permease protein
MCSAIAPGGWSWWANPTATRITTRRNESADVSAQLSWNPADDVRQLLAFHFMVNALRAGTIVAVVAGAIGYFMVLRRQSFAGHTLAVIGFPGAAGAIWLGINASFGYFGFCIAGALVIAALSRNGRASGGLGGYPEESAVIGTVQAFALACGFLFVSLYKGFLSGLNSLLFGSIIGVTDTQLVTLLVAGVGCLAALAVFGRRLLFASVDPDVAQARGIPVRLVNAAFLVLLGIAAAGTSQVTGSLLVFALLVAPAATAVRLTARPAAGLVLSVVLALAVTWVGEGIAFFSPYPIGFWVTTLAFGSFLLAASYRAVVDRAGRRGASRAERVTASAAGSPA